MLGKWYDQSKSIVLCSLADILEAGISLEAVAGSETSCYVGCSSKGMIECSHQLCPNIISP